MMFTTLFPLQMASGLRHRPRAMSWRRWLAVLSWMMVWAAAGLAPAAHAVGSDGLDTVVEQRIKAATLYKFLGYVEWPPAALPASASYVIGVSGADDLADELVAVSTGRTIANRTVSVRKIRAGEPLTGIHVLFIGRAERSRLAQWIQLAQKQPILSITETEGALAQGSMINFRVAEERVRFEVALDTASRAGLQIGSGMLSVAIFVQRGPRQ